MRAVVLLLILFVQSLSGWNLNSNAHRDKGANVNFNRKTFASEEIDEDSDLQNDYTNSRTSKSFPPLTKTQYFYKTHQSATVSIPHHRNRNRISVGPDENETKSYVTKVDTIPLDSRKHQKNPRDEDKNQMKPFFRSGKFCIKCPPEKILIAKRGLDGVLIETPALTTCSDKPVLKSLFELETLFSKKHHFILPRGSHTFIGQIINKKDDTVEHVCNLKYKIIVRNCGPYIVKNEDVKVKCDLTDIWGSTCTFSCKNNGILSHLEPMVCNDNLKWQGVEPDCIVKHKDYYRQIEGAITRCQLPSAPEHGKFSCKVDRELIKEVENELYIPELTVCRVKCARSYEIHDNLERYATFQCRNGRWNHTHHFNLCSKVQSKRIG